MKLFKKREEKDKLSNKIGHKIMGNIYDNVKLRSAILLGLWAIFIIFLLLFLSRVNTNRDTSEKVVEYPNINTLFNKDYDMEITLYDNELDKYIYYIGDLDKGIKKENDIEINYQKINNLYYDLDNNEIENPFNNIDIYFLDLNNIKNTITNINANKEIEGSLYIYKYNIKYLNQDIVINIKANDNNLTNINYKLNNYNYTLNLNVKS